LYNFKGNEGVHCQGHCAKLHPVFINYKDGRNHLRRMNLNHYKNFRQKFKDEIFYARILEDSTLYMKLFITEMLNLTEKKAIRNCMFCKYHAYKAHPHEVFDHDLPYFEDVKYPCKMQGGLLVNSNEALSCEYYNSNTPFEYEHYLSGKEDH
ncbi:MAG: hypothetical protein CL663_00825, partial [Bacteroidetes bacterium]|nr:hypothetical protein [Bacteroidota bacterium]